MRPQEIGCLERIEPEDQDAEKIYNVLSRGESIASQKDCFEHNNVHLET